ncbi:MAG: peptidase S8 and S53 subtilisin kexin sedolisin [Catenulispora sp.]|nr:peptidase S8 and S53 subtilisin kexin sedolisin [Catenulispora sp.]
MEIRTLQTPVRSAARRGIILGSAVALGAAALTVLGLPATAVAASSPVSVSTTGTTTSTLAATSDAATTTATTSSNGKGKLLEPVCTERGVAKKAACLALRYTPQAKTNASLAQSLAQPSLLTSAPSGYGPADLLSAYDLPADGGAGQTIAIVDALDDPTAEADLAVYRAQYGLPACTTANGCFSKVDQRGGTNYPYSDAEWAGEISLDLDMVSAIAPEAHILLVETDDAGDISLGEGVNEAVALGAKFVSNSYTEPENPQEAANLDGFYNHPGVAVVAASGDAGYAVNYPAASQYVTAVGGTTLTKDPNTLRGWTEAVWNRDGFYAPGSGCSAYEPKPTFQTDTGCANRTVADVSAVADGVAVYQTYGARTPGWGEFAGTSVATPVIASIYADAGTPTPGTYPNSYPYATNGAGLNDVTSGANGSCPTTYLCTAGPGFDGPTGLGTPVGLSAFSNGPRGVLSGTVTDSATGKPVNEAVVSADGFTTRTNAQGHYSIQLPVGDDTVSVSAFGYTTAGADFTITDGGSTTGNITLKPIQRHTVTGKVTDGSGHHWPLYAQVQVETDPDGPVWTNPATGVYRISLPQGQTFKLDVTSGIAGYDPATTQVAVAQSDTKADIALTADAEQATAPGYALQVGGQTQTFDSATSAPTGWTVTNAAGTNHGWEFTDYEGRGNLTGGTGNFAIVDSDYYGWSQDSQLTSPAVDLSSVGAADLSFDTSYLETNGEKMNADVSTDGGATWSTVWSAPMQAANYQHVSVPLPGAAGHSGVMVRFHYTASWSYFWQIDDVLISTHTLTPTPGGLIVGAVTDANTGAGLVGATVTTTRGTTTTATTIATPGDPNVADGFYDLFMPGSIVQPITATAPGYKSRTEPAAVLPDLTVWAPFGMKPLD